MRRRRTGAGLRVFVSGANPMESRESNSPLVALLTDFGNRDHFVAAVKARILSLSDPRAIVDISHEIAPHDVGEAAFTLAACHREFPSGTVFVAVVDPGVGSDRRPIVAEADGRVFVGPDNGIFSFVLRGRQPARVFRIDNAETLSDSISSTFHARDVFAPAAAALVRGTPPSSFGPAIPDFIRFGETKRLDMPSDRIEVEVVHVDRFGNLILDLGPAHAGRPFAVRIGDRRIGRVASHYAEYPDGLPFVILGSCGLYEISVYAGSAAGLLGCGRGSKVIAELS